MTTAIDIDLKERLDQLEARFEAKKAELSDLATMGAIITSILDIQTVLSVVMDMAIRLVDGEVGLVMLEEDGELRPSVSWGVSEDAVRNLMFQDQQDLPTYCFSTGQGIILNDLGIHEENGMSIESIVCLPIKTSDKCHGVLLIINKADDGEFTEDDRESLKMLLNFVAVAIDNSNLLKEQLQRQKIEQEMAIAGQVQETILPQNIDDFDGVEIGAAYFPAREVGGDYYDVVRIDAKRFVVVLGDVSNKGVPAALIMSAAAGIIKSVLSAEPNISVSDLASRLNTILVNDIIKEREMFATLFICRFDLEEMVLTYTNAGHLPGLFWDSFNQMVVQLAEGGSIVGQFDDMQFKQGQRPLASGDSLFLFTDGLTEAADADGNLFGRERAEQVFSIERGLGPKEFCLKVKEWIDRFTVGGPEDMQDDFTILEIRVC